MDNAHKLTPPEIFNSEQFKMLRSGFDQNRKHGFCKTCWDMEKRGIEPFYIHNDDTLPRGELDVIDFTLSNKCNLACRMCDPQTSHKLMLDWKFFKQQGLINDIEKVTAGKFTEELQIPNVKNSIQYKWLLNNPVKELRFSGGEPFFDSLLIDLLDKYIKEQSSRLTNNIISRRQFVMSVLATGVTLPIALSLADKADAATANKGGHFRWGNGAADTTDTLDPATYQSSFMQAVAWSYQNCLTVVDSDHAVLPELAEMWPEKFTNVTNGVTPRRWVALANPELSDLLDKEIGPDWVTNLDQHLPVENVDSSVIDAPC